MLKRSLILALATIALVSVAAFSVVISAAALSVTSTSAKPYEIFLAPQGGFIPADLG